MDPINDLETIKTEILLADIIKLEKKLQKNSKKKISEKEIKFSRKYFKKIKYW